MYETGGVTREETRGAIPLIILAMIACAFCLLAAVLLQSTGGDMDIWQQAFFISGVSLRTIFTYHQFPFWNPWASGGVPHLAYPFSSFLSPSFMLSVLFGPELGLTLRILLMLWIGLWGGYMLGRRLSPGIFAPYLLACVFLFSSWYPLYMSQWHVEFMPFAYLPWMLLFFYRGLEDIRFCACGGAVLAVMVLEGGSYPVPYAILFLFCYALLEAIARRNIRPIAAGFLIVLLGVSISGIKLLPMLEFLSRHRRATFWREPILPWAAIPRILFGRDQLRPTDFTGAWLGWWEYGAYVGIVPFLLALAAPLLAPRKAFPFFVLLLLFGSLMFGDYGTLSPWRWLHALPPFSSLHDACRFRVLLVFSVALLSAIAMSRIEGRVCTQGGEKRRWAIWLCGAVVMCVVVDLLIVTAPIYSHFAKRPFSRYALQGPFRQTRLAHEQRQGALSFVCFLRNEGLIDNVDGLELPPADVRAYGDGTYRGEVWLEGGAGVVDLLSWSPNRLSYAVHVRKGDVVIINQRYDPGWKCADGRPVHSRGGLIAIPVEEADSTVCIYYMPRYFIVGGIFSVVGLVFSFMIWGTGRRAHG